MQKSLETQIPTVPHLGYGLGLRAPHYAQILEERPTLDFFEVISENFLDMHGGYTEMLQDLRQDYALILHGVSLSIGSTDGFSEEYFRKLKRLAEAVQPAFISDHLCFTGVEGINTHDLLPVPFTKESLTHITQRVDEWQQRMGRRFTIENPSSYLEFAESTMLEADFMAELLERADCHMLMDVNNIFVSSINHGYDAFDYIDKIPTARIAYVHLAGHSRKNGYLLDTHDHPVPDEVWDLYSYTIAQKGTLNTMVEWDDKLPSFETLISEIEKAQLVANHAELAA